jgi:hypothetical protein
MLLQDVRRYQELLSVTCTGDGHINFDDNEVSSDVLATRVSPEVYKR